MRFSNLARMASLLPALCVAGCGDSGGGVNSASSNSGGSYTRFNDLSGAQTMAASGLMYNVRMINGAVTLTVDASDPAIATAGLVTVLRRSPERFKLVSGDRRDDQA